MSENKNEVVKLNIYLTRRMYDSLKLMGLLTRSSMSQIIRESLKDKLKKLNKEIKE